MKQELTTAAWVQASALNDPLTTHLPAWKHNYTHLEDTPLVLLADAQAMLDAKDAEIAALKSTIEAERDLNQRLRVLPFLSDRIVALITAYGDARADEDVPATVRTLADLIHEARRIMIAAPQAATDKDAEIAALRKACEASEQCITDLLEVYGNGGSMLILDEAVKSLKNDALKLVRKAMAQAVQPCSTCQGRGYTDPGDPETGATHLDYPCHACDGRAVQP